MEQRAEAEQPDLLGGTHVGEQRPIEQAAPVGGHPRLLGGRLAPRGRQPGEHGDQHRGEQQQGHRRPHHQQRTRETGEQHH
ncbi:hypothetical protein [Nonomuraea candida]|uniref:hypothetical protein n=1 Tax=Nonomuraea candida TaxID=359159 RepID=UPI0012F97EFA|nr:hypothetical protein [Nonomuraea candida]